MTRGELCLGEQLPTEQELCGLYNVSRITARKALVLLHEAGIIERSRGRGSFVAKLPDAVPQPGHSAGSTPSVRPTRPKATEIGIIRSTSTAPGSERDDWWASILRALESRLQEEDFHPTGLPPPVAGASPAPLLARLDELGERLAGLVFLANAEMIPFLPTLEKRGLPWVSINQIHRRQTSNFVAVDNHGGGYTVGRLFAQLGYAPVVVVGPELGRRISTADKFFGFMQGYLEAGRFSTDVRYLPIPDLGSSDENARRLRSQLDRADRPRAIFCVGDLLAATVLRLCQELRLSVPEDLAVVGGTGLLFAEHTTPPMTLLAQPMQEVGHEAAGFLIEMIRTGDRHLPGRFIPSPLMVRASCPGAAPGAAS